ncbi:MAG: hypothetical protein IPM47_03965 [Sphingobacteriales bacterium]|nr:MAG: hypothetical protein IPM47_03965 [Sphingobacteriales bacterium]
MLTSAFTQDATDEGCDIVLFKFKENGDTLYRQAGCCGNFNRQQRLEEISVAHVPAGVYYYRVVEGK